MKLFSRNLFERWRIINVTIFKVNVVIDSGSKIIAAEAVVLAVEPFIHILVVLSVILFNSNSEKSTTMFF